MEKSDLGVSFVGTLLVVRLHDLEKCVSVMGEIFWDWWTMVATMGRCWTMLTMWKMRVALGD